MTAQANRGAADVGPQKEAVSETPNRVEIVARWLFNEDGHLDWLTVGPVTQGIYRDKARDLLAKLGQSTPPDYPPKFDSEHPSEPRGVLLWVWEWMEQASEALPEKAPTGISEAAIDRRAVWDAVAAARDAIRDAFPGRDVEAALKAAKDPASTPPEGEDR